MQGNDSNLIGSRDASEPDGKRSRSYLPTDQVTVLLGEPDPTLAAHVAAAWGDGFVRVQSCATAGELMFLAGRLRPELVVTRASFPDSSVPDVVTTVRAHDTVPIVVSVAAGETELAGPALSAGATELTDHPYRDDALRELAQRHLRVVKARMLQAARVEIGALFLDGPAYTAWVNGRRLTLTTREFEVLQLLVNHAERVVTFEDLRGLVWRTRGEDVTRQTVNVHMYRIRGQIADAAEVTTVRGVGYRLTPTVTD